MILYFDNKKKVNLHNIEIIRTIRDFSQWESRLFHKDFEIRYSKEYIEKGIYPIEISKLTHQWLSPQFNLISKIPEHIIKAVQAKKLRVMIMAVVEGDSFIKSDNDAFSHLHTAIKNKGLPSKSIVIISGNLKAQVSYSKWCKVNNEQPLVEFIQGMDYWDGKHCGWNLPEGVLINGATNHHEYPASFNSLNRAHRAHRTDHLYFLAKSGMLATSLVSGGVFFKKSLPLSPTYLKVDQSDFQDTLLSNYPRSIDFSHDDLQTTNPANHINEQVYDSSLLTVVTETEFDSKESLFFSEKVFKPISMGHPFMILGSSGFIKTLKNFGFDANFIGIDMRYDEIEDPTDRFIAFHKSLQDWHRKPLEAKKTFGATIWRKQLIDNLEKFKKWDIGKVMMQNLLDSTNQYFLDNPTDL